MRLVDLEPSENVVEVLCSTEQPTICTHVPVINGSIPTPPQAPSLLVCIYLFALTISIAYWVDVWFLRRDNHD